jgi:hypothetical protein
MDESLVHGEIQATLRAGCITHRGPHTGVSLRRIASHRNGPHIGVMYHVGCSCQSGAWGWALTCSLHRLRGEQECCQHKHDEHRYTYDRTQILLQDIMSPILKMCYYGAYTCNYTYIIYNVNIGNCFTRLYTLKSLEHHFVILPRPFCHWLIYIVRC